MVAGLISGGPGISQARKRGKERSEEPEWREHAPAETQRGPDRPGLAQLLSGAPGLWEERE